MKRRFATQLIAAGLLGMAAGQPFAQSGWPTRPIRLIVPTPPGSSSDIFARLIADELAKKLGQAIVVENKPGANGRIGTAATLAAAPDGQTLLLSFGSAIVGARVLFPKDKSDATKLQPISRFGSQGAILAVSADVPARNIKEFAAWVKASREPVNYASYGVGSGGHIVMEALLKSLGIQANHVPYKDSNLILSDMRSGLVKVAALDAVTPIPYLKQHQIHGIGVNGRFRLPETPDIPTLAEQGLPIYMESWYGIFAPRGIPRAIVDRINAEVGTITASPAMMERFKLMNLTSTPPISPEEFDKFIHSEIKVWGDVVAASNIHLD
ncbi:tripartite tricarboxylate transporter substrate binding protein [Comamonas humi]